jgi:endonuclease VIII
MWLAEALWHARLSPHATLGELADDELRRALGETHRLMRVALEGVRPPRRAYRRAGRPCPRCGTPIASRGLGEANRTAYWCPSCQGEA